MPGLDGFEVCRRLRADGDTTPVIFLTAADTSQRHRSTGFAAGRRRPPDQAVQPPGPRSPGSRPSCAGPAAVRATARSSGSCYADLELDERRPSGVARHGELVALCPDRVQAAALPAAQPEQVLSKAQIAEHIWQYDFGGDANIVETLHVVPAQEARRTPADPDGAGRRLRAADRGVMHAAIPPPSRTRWRMTRVGDRASCSASPPSRRHRRAQAARAALHRRTSTTT